jgi:integrase
VSFKGLHFVRKARSGQLPRWYVYAWRGGPCVAKRDGRTKPILTGRELANVAHAVEQLGQPDPRQFHSLVREWRKSPEWNNLAANTQRTWDCQLRRIEDKWGETPIAVWSDPRVTAKVVKWRDSRRGTPRGADLGVMVLRELLRFARLRGHVSFNAAAEVPSIYRGGNRADIVWSEADIDRFCWWALKLNKPEMIDGIWLAALTGLRSADLVTVTDQNVYDYAIIKRALKISRRKRRTATMPRIPELDSLLTELALRHRKDGVRSLLVNSWGKSWTASGFGGTFNRVRDAANIVHIDEETGEARRKHLHDLRGTFATRLISAGLTDNEVADVMGWAKERVAQIRAVYVDQRATVVAIGERIAASGVNCAVNLRGSNQEN